MALVAMSSTETRGSVEEDPWERLRQSRPRLRGDIKIYVQHYRNEDWYLLADPLTNQQLRLDAVSHALVRQLEHGATVGAALEQIDAEISIEDAGYLLMQLREAGMLRGDLKPTAEEAIAQKKRLVKVQQLRRWLTPLAIKIPLLDPDKWLAKGVFIPRLMFTSWGGYAFACLLVTAAIAAMNHWSALQVHWSSRFVDPDNLLWTLALYPLVKGFHEFGHGLAAKHWGAEVHEMGVMMLVFLPVPYVDASSTGTFHFARHRMAVAAAGILTELLLASVALIAWCYVTPGFARDMLFNVLVIGGVSTLLFNGNPLLRFDGYYVLSDALRIPNLGARASGYLGYLFKSIILGLDSYKPLTSRGEVPWLCIYGVASGIYRLLLSFTIALYVASRFFVIGLLIAAWFLLYQVLRPYILAAVRTIPIAMQQQRLTRYLATVGSLTVLLPALLMLTPVQQSTTGYGVILPPESSIVRVKTPGFATTTVPESGAQLKPTDTILRLHDDDLLYRKLQLDARIDAADTLFRSALAQNSADTGRLKADLASLEAELGTVQADISSLVVTSQNSGRFSSLLPRNISGRWLNEGDLIGVVTGPDDWIIEVMIPQTKIDLVRRDSRSVQAISLSRPQDVIPAIMASETPLATQYLPNKSLGTMSGGPLSVDARDPSGLTLVTPMFQVSVQLADANYHVGQTMLVRFLHGSEPLGVRWLRGFRRLLSQELRL